ncbi:MAG: YkgJ family cysteine cluster protein [Planctomycetes bacterium]|nr:YkgJ family cysteine cluster protein [Planctomycetota bacterium]
MTQLPLIAIPSCEGCGACCTYVGVPPGFGKFYFDNPDELPGEVWNSADGIRWRDMPDELRATLIAQYEGMLDGTIVEIPNDVTPCIWLNQTTRQCGHYDWRPQICRDFQMGSGACRAMRQGEGIDA